MALEDFHHLVRRLANQAWVRYYLHMYQGKIVLEMALPIEAPEPTDLTQDLIRRGFSVVPCVQYFPGLRVSRWVVDRTDLSPDATGA